MGEGGGRDLKMNLQPRAKQPSEERGEKAAPARGPARRGLSAALPGVSHRPGSLPNCLAGMGEGVALLMSGTGSWGRPWESGFFSGLVGSPQ